MPKGKKVPRQRTVVGETARDYCIKFPNTASIELARMLRRDHPLLFASVEHARETVRYYRGSKGQKNFQDASASKSLVERYEIPAPEPSSFSIFALPEDVGRWLVLADIHAPFHDAEALALVLDWESKAKNHCDGIVLLGDVADCYSLSPWLRDPRKRRFPEEISAVEKILDSLQKHIKPKRFIWKCGNHEFRLERYLMSHAAELFGLPQFTFRSFLNLEQRGITWVDHGNPIRYHALTMLHGDEWGAGFISPVNPARTAFLKTFECALVAHQHKSSEHTERTMFGRNITCWSLGCLCDTHPEYRPLNSWNLGFADLAIREGWRIGNHRIVNGEIV